MYDLLGKIFLVDGKNPSIAVATTGGKVFVHSAFKESDQSNNK
jgi:hypothetical protein